MSDYSDNRCYMCCSAEKGLEGHCSEDCNPSDASHYQGGYIPDRPIGFRSLTKQAIVKIMIEEEYRKKAIQGRGTWTLKHVVEQENQKIYDEFSEFFPEGIFPTNISLGMLETILHALC